MPTQENRLDLAVQRVRHPPKFRLLQVRKVQPLTPHLIRVTLTGEDLHDFVSASFDDHIKVFFPEPGADKPVLPQAGPEGPVFPEGRRPVARDFTPRLEKLLGDGKLQRQPRRVPLCARQSPRR